MKILPYADASAMNLGDEVTNCAEKDGLAKESSQMKKRETVKAHCLNQESLSALSYVQGFRKRSVDPGCLNNGTLPRDAGSFCNNAG